MLCHNIGDIFSKCTFTQVVFKLKKNFFLQVTMFNEKYNQSITPLTFPRGVKLKPSRPNPATFFLFQMDFLRSERFSRKSAAEIIITLRNCEEKKKNEITHQRYQIFLSCRIVKIGRSWINFFNFNKLFRFYFVDVTMSLVS